MKRTGKFYRRNEEEVMRALGLEPTPNSGSGWIVKEDGQSEHIICQLKSTDAQSIRIDQKDIKTLESNASTTHKVPVFAIQFLNDGSTYVMCRPEDLRAMAEFVDTGEVSEERLCLSGITLCDDTEVEVTTKVSSSKGARDSFHEERQKQYEGRSRR